MAGDDPTGWWEIKDMTFHESLRLINNPPRKITLRQKLAAEAAREALERVFVKQYLIQSPHFIAPCPAEGEEKTENR